MVGIIDTGGSFRAVFADGVLDCLQDMKISVDYFIGVSAGAANGASFVAGQRGRNTGRLAIMQERHRWISMR